MRQLSEQEMLCNEQVSHDQVTDNGCAWSKSGCALFSQQVRLYSEQEMMYCELEDCKVYSLHVKDLSQKILLWANSSLHWNQICTEYFGIQYFGDSPYQLCWELAIPSIVDNEESIFDYAYLGKFKAKIARVQQLYNEPITNRILQKIGNRSNCYATYKAFNWALRGSLFSTCRNKATENILKKGKKLLFVGEKPV